MGILNIIRAAKYSDFVRVIGFSTYLAMLRTDNTIRTDFCAKIAKGVAHYVRVSVLT